MKYLILKNLLLNLFVIGLFLHTSGLLGASPDGICDQFSLEIKCPYKFRNGNLKEVLKPAEKYIVHYCTESNSFILNKAHDYYHQIQSQIHFTNCDFGVLYIWTPHEQITMKVEKEKEWASNIHLLLDFYHYNYIPHILS